MLNRYRVFCCLTKSFLALISSEASEVVLDPATFAYMCNSLTVNIYLDLPVSISLAITLNSLKLLLHGKSIVIYILIFTHAYIEDLLHRYPLLSSIPTPM